MSVTGIQQVRCFAVSACRLQCDQNVIIVKDKFHIIHIQGAVFT